jgi:glutamine amidotransferase
VSPRVGVCDYGVGNLRSVERALLRAGADVVISDDAGDIAECAGVVLPGVGAFAAAAEALRRDGLDDAVRFAAAAGRPVLGVCLGYQMLFERSEEGEGGEGLGLLHGSVSRLPANGLKVPHMGWNRMHVVNRSPLLDGVADGSFVYFVHSYAAQPAPDEVIAVVDYGGELAAAAQRGNVMGTQFHPEKSGTAGLQVYANLVTLCAA